MWSPGASGLAAADITSLSMSWKLPKPDLDESSDADRTWKLGDSSAWRFGRCEPKKRLISPEVRSLMSDVLKELTVSDDDLRLGTWLSPETSNTLVSAELLDAGGSSTIEAEPCWSLKAKSESLRFLPGRSRRQLFRTGEESAGSCVDAGSEADLCDSQESAMAP